MNLILFVAQVAAALFSALKNAVETVLLLKGSKSPESSRTKREEEE